MLLSHFYKRKKSQSIEQLKNDFGCFPPLPLSHTGSCFEYDQIVISKLLYPALNLTQCVRVFNKLIRYHACKKDDRPYDSSGLIDHVASAIDSCIDLKKTTDKLPILSKAICIASLILLMPLIILASLIALFSIVIRKPTFQGVYLPFSEQIVLIKSNGISSTYWESILSHEHIHFLQDMHRSQVPKACKEITNPSSYLNNVYQKNPHALYLLRSVEVEARLHELVLSYYRAFKRLPTTYSGFLEMLHGCRNLTKTVSEIYKISNIKFDFNKDHSFNVRQPELIKELSICFRAFANFEDEIRFIRQVLPVMYANLLIYYGDEKSSQKFREKIPDSRFYFELYQPGPEH